MAPYIAERLLLYKRNVEGSGDLSSIFTDPLDDQRVTLNDIEYRFIYSFDRGSNKAKLKVNLSPLNSKAKSKLENHFKIKYFPMNVLRDNLRFCSFNYSEDGEGKEYFIFDTELISIHDKKTYQSFFKNFVEPFI